MPGYLDQIKQIHQTDRTTEPRGPDNGSIENERLLHDKTNQGKGEVGTPQFHLGYEFNEFNEIRSTILERLRAGQTWLLDQHQRWQSGDTNAASDAEFSRVWNGWWNLDFRLRAEYGLAGCIYGSSDRCPGDFGCIGCVDAPDPALVAHLVLVDAR